MTLLLAAVFGCSLVSPAAASFGPIELQSVGPLDQFEAAGEPALAADGRYLAFEGSLDGVKGIFRKDLQTGQLELVAGGSLYEPPREAPLDASAPSISADGRYVAFTSAARLLSAAEAGTNVYVRDMEAPAPDNEGGASAACSDAEEQDENGTRCAFELASALDGSTRGIDTGGAGAVAAGRVALSGDGREVAFVVRGESDLLSHDREALSTPPLQVAVRYLESDRTVLVSAERDQQTGEMTERPVVGGAVTPTSEGTSDGGRTVLPGAALSADGSTVAWLGAHIPAQAPTLVDERARIEHDDQTTEPYDEPLWRRIAEGSGAPTRRIVGGGDPLAPGCPADGTLEMPVCDGPFPQLLSDLRSEEGRNAGWLAIEGYDGTPQLSADGRIVALIGDPRPGDAPQGDEGGTSNVFVVDMDEGLSRRQALRQLTREVPALSKANPGASPAYVATAGDVYDLAISPDGERIAFTTQREQFPLAPPNFTEAPLTQLGVTELYEIDLGTETLRRVTHGPGDGASLITRVAGVTNEGAWTPSFGEGGQTIAFADKASNLVSGDANEASDVFSVSDLPTTIVPGSVAIGSLPGGGVITQPTRWRLGVVALAHADGSATLEVSVPGGGTLTATATAGVPVRLPLRSARGPGRSTKRGVSRVVIRGRNVALAQMSAALPSTLELPLRVVPRYRSLLLTRAGIYATVRIAFKGTGGPALSQDVTLTLRRRIRRPPHGPSRPGKAKP